MSNWPFLTQIRCVSFLLIFNEKKRLLLPLLRFAKPMQSFEWSWMGLGLLMPWASRLCPAEAGREQRSGAREVQAPRVAELLLPACGRGEVSLASEREARGADTRWPWCFGR